MLGLLEPLSGWLTDAVRRSSPSSIGFLPLATSTAVGRPGAPGLVLIGDAAHPMLPAALSTCVAFEDARRLGDALAGERDRPLRERASQAAPAIREAAF